MKIGLQFAALCLVLIFVAPGISTGQETAPTRSGDSRLPTQIGMHTTTADLNRLKAWEAWTGELVPIVGENLFATSWDDFTGRNSDSGIGFTLAKWEVARRDPDFLLADGKLPVLDFALPMFPDRAQAGAPAYVDISERWEQGAAGEFDRHFRALAETLVKKGFGDCHLRLAWEFNLPAGLNRWAIRDTPEAWPHFITYWQRIHDAMMSLEGANFLWGWSILLGDDEGDFLPTRDAWPGDDYVDIIGVDIYDGSGNYYWQQYEMEAPEVEWETLRDWNWEYLAKGIERDPYSGEVRRAGLGCLDSYRAFAAEKGKRFAITEWGVVQGELFPASDHWGGNDNPDFIEKMHHWIQENDVAYALYFENFMAHRKYGDVDHSLLPGYWNQPGVSPDFVHTESSAHPRSAARYLSLFHGKPELLGFSWSEPVLSFAERFDRLPKSPWTLGEGWQWKRDALHVAKATESTTAIVSYSASSHDLISARIAISVPGEKAVEFIAGPYTVGLQSSEQGVLQPLTLRRGDAGSEDYLASGRPDSPLVIGRMFVPVSIEIKRLSGRPDLATILVRIAGDERPLITFLDSGLPEQTDAILGIRASSGADVFLDDLEVRPVVDP